MHRGDLIINSKINVHKSQSKDIDEKKYKQICTEGGPALTAERLSYKKEETTLLANLLRNSFHEMDKC